MKRYCHSCGKPSEPASAKFCCHCGVSLSFASPPPKSEAIKAKAEKRDDNDDNDDNDEEGDGDRPTSFRGVLEKGLDFEFQKSPQVGEKLENVIGTRSPASSSKQDGEQIEHQSSEEAMKEFQREAGTLRPKK